MVAFLMTWKEAGWPHSNILRMIREFERRGRVIEPWRIHGHQMVQNGDTVWLLKQGKGKKGIFGVGRVNGPPSLGDIGNGDMRMMVPVRFSQLVDPKKEFLIDETAIKRVLTLNQVNARASGETISDRQSTKLDKLLSKSTVKKKLRRGHKIAELRNPPWSRDELIVALDFYLRHRGSVPPKGSRQIRVLSNNLNRLGKFLGQVRSRKYRNINGTYMKLMNFLSLDPEYTVDGKVGLTRGGKEEKSVWAKFANDPTVCHETAKAILFALDQNISTNEFNADEDDFEAEAEEGRILTRLHQRRERSRKLIERKKKQIHRNLGKLECECCGFDFADVYGERGDGFIECHHLKPVTDLKPGARTRLKDLAVVCANCHRMIHRKKPWLTIAELKDKMST